MTVYLIGQIFSYDNLNSKHRRFLVICIDTAKPVTVIHVTTPLKKFIMS